MADPDAGTAQNRQAPLPRAVAAMLLSLPAGLVAAPAAAQAGVEDPPAADIRIDGRLTEPAWEDARRITEFVQGEPVEGAAPDEPTEVRVLFAEDAIYVGARMEESRAIARQLVRRDAIGQADYFQVSFDPNMDRRTGYEFRVSAAGVQRDAYLFEDNQTDASWDAVWESEAAVAEGGWSVELRIPWSQLRYEPGEGAQTWGINFVRWRVAAGERTYHALVPRNQHGRVSFFRPMRGIHVPSSGRRIELRPYVLARAHTGPAEPGNPFYDGQEADAQTGLDLRYGLGSAFTLDATINPDFGQVELDPAVINLSAFETFFDEKRPFFVEDARVFDFGLSGFGNTLFYSRRIGRAPQGDAPGDAAYADIPGQSTILGAAKLTGRTAGGLSLGALAAVTGAEEGRAFFPGDSIADDSTTTFLAAPRSYHGVLRAQKDLREGATTIGAIGTGIRRDLPEDGSFDFLTSEAFSGGVDFEHMWGDREWAVEGFVAGSWVRGDSAALIRIQRSSNHYFQRPDSDLYVDSTLTSLGGLSWQLGASRRSGEHWTGGVSVGQVTPGFEVNDLGFSRSSESLALNANVQYSEIEPGPLLRSYRIGVSTFQNWRRSALDRPLETDAWEHAHKDGSFWIDSNWTFNNFWGGFAEYAYRPEVLEDATTRGGPLIVAPANRKLELRLNSDPRRELAFEGGINHEAGRAFTLLSTGLYGVWRPNPRVELQVGPEYTHHELVDQYVATFDDAAYQPTFGRRYLFGGLDRHSLGLETRLDVTFTRDLTLQLFLQPLIEAGAYDDYRQLAQPASFDFLEFEPGTPVDPDGDGQADSCVGGRICELGGTQYIDFDGDADLDASFRDRDFNVVSLRGNAVLRWEYRPGSTVFLVWQQQRFGRRPFGDFDLGRDRRDLLDLHPDNVFMVKISYWVGL